MLDEINQDYVRTARAKGVGENRIMWVHVLRNASIPIITHVMAALPGLLIGAFLIERFFSIPGIGREVILAVERSDFPVIKALTVYVAIATMVVNLARRPHVQGGRSAGAAQMTGTPMDDLALEVRRRAPARDPAHRLAGPVDARLAPLRRDRVAMVSLAIVAAFLADDGAVGHRRDRARTGRARSA